MANKALDAFNHWRRYRNEPEYTEQQWKASPHRTQAYTDADKQPLDIGVPLILWRIPQVPAVPKMNIPFNALNKDQQAFLSRRFQTTSADPTRKINWVGKKMLGEGSFGRVGMWENQDKSINWGRTRVACKEGKLNHQNVLDADLSTEAAWMKALRTRRSEHIVQFIAPEFAEGHTGANVVFNGMMTRIYMEYCDLGSIQILLQRRLEEQKPFSEATLWRLFDCLIDGACAMKYGGAEPEWNPLTNSYQIDTSYEPDAIHFDLKPGNVFLGNRNMTHTDSPVAKVGDFGLVTPGYWDADLTPDRRKKNTESMRRQGTRTYLAPEQFTRRFDLIGWENDPKVGNYSYKMNIWGMGVIMWQLATLSWDAPSASRPFLSTFPIKGRLAAGVCYGVDLEAYSFTKGLKDAIFSCLYEDPRLRMNIVELKTHIRAGILNSASIGDVVDPWESFLPYEPPNTATPAPPPGLPIRQLNPAAAGFAPVPQVNPVIPAAQVVPVAPAVQVIPAVIPPAVLPLPLPPAPARTNYAGVSFGRLRYINTTCQFEYSQGALYGVLCGKPCRATQASIDANEARCRTHPLNQFPHLGFQNTA